VKIFKWQKLWLSYKQHAWARWGFKWTLNGKFCVKNKSWDTRLQGCTKPWWQVTTMTKVCKVMPHLFVGPQCGTWFMHLLIPKICTWFTHFCKICAPLWYCKWTSRNGNNQHGDCRKAMSKHSHEVFSLQKCSYSQSWEKSITIHTNKLESNWKNFKALPTRLIIY
jgi:hypothetical protein